MYSRYLILILSKIRSNKEIYTSSLKCLSNRFWTANSFVVNTDHVAEHEGGKEHEVYDPHDVDAVRVEGSCRQGKIAHHRPVGQDHVTYIPVELVYLGEEVVWWEGDTLLIII